MYLADSASEVAAPQVFLCWAFRCEYLKNLTQNPITPQRRSSHVLNLKSEAPLIMEALLAMTQAPSVRSGSSVASQE